LGRANCRLKHYYDVWMLTSTFDIEPARLQRAIAATFARRKTGIPGSVPDGLSDDFYADAGKQRQWDAFARTLSGQVPELGRVVLALREKLVVISAPNRR